MKKEIFDFSEALKRMRKGKLVKRENGLYPFGIAKRQRSIGR